MTTLSAWFMHALTFFPHPYLVPFLGAVLGGEETILVIAALAAGGGLTFLEVLALSYAGTMVSDLLWFIFGVRFNAWIAQRPGYHEKLEKVADFANGIARGRHFLTLLITKFLYGTRIITIFYIAKERITFLRFALYNGIVTAIWAIIICGIGWYAGKGITWMEKAFSSLSLALTSFAITLIAIYALRLWLNKIIVTK